MSKKATEFQRKAMSWMYRDKEIFKPLNTGWIDENVACVREWVANIFFYRKGDTTIMVDAGYNYDRLAEKWAGLGLIRSRCSQGDWRVGQPPASIQPGLYAGLQRPERPFRQRLFPVSRKGRGQRDENADRKDRIWRQTMKYAGMPFGMWVLFAGSFQKPPTATPTRGTWTFTNTRMLSSPR
mgnify:CR=1 FL=1